MNNFLKKFDLEIKAEEEIRAMSPLILAYIGDALYEVYIRTYIVHEYKGKVHDLHKIATRFVKASGQANIAHSLKEELTEREWDIIKRGRNQKSGSVPKNANISDYKYATGFEYLIGYLYLMGKNERLEEIIAKAIGVIEKKK